MKDQGIRLQLACHAAGFTPEQIIRLETTVRDVCEHEGLDAESTERVYLALEQMVSTGRIERGTLVQQLGSLLRSVPRALAKTLGCMPLIAYELMDAGRVHSDAKNIIGLMQSLHSIVKEDGPFRGPPGWMGGRPHAA